MLPELPGVGLVEVFVLVELEEVEEPSRLVVVVEVVGCLVDLLVVVVVDFVDLQKWRFQY